MVVGSSRDTRRGMWKFGLKQGNLNVASPVSEGISYGLSVLGNLVAGHQVPFLSSPGVDVELTDRYGFAFEREVGCSVGQDETNGASLGTDRRWES